MPFNSIHTAHDCGYCLVLQYVLHVDCLAGAVVAMTTSAVSGVSHHQLAAHNNGAKQSS